LFFLSLVLVAVSLYWVCFEFVRVCFEFVRDCTGLYGFFSGRFFCLSHLVGLGDLRFDSSWEGSERFRERKGKVRLSPWLILRFSSLIFRMVMKRRNFGIFSKDG